MNHPAASSKASASRDRASTDCSGTCRVLNDPANSTDAYRSWAVGSGCLLHLPVGGNLGAFAIGSRTQNTAGECAVGVGSAQASYATTPYAPSTFAYPFALPLRLDNG